MTNHEWDDNERPLAYLITIRTYGTWLHGDDRYSMDRHGKNIYGAPKIAASTNLAAMMRDNRLQESFLLDGQQRGIVEMAVKGVCKHRGYGLYAINVRTNHVHSVVSSSHKPEPIIIAFKSNSTRELRAAGLVSDQQSVWSRGGSRRYLWKSHHVESAVNYVLFGQGDDLPDF